MFEKWRARKHRRESAPGVLPSPGEAAPGQLPPASDALADEDLVAHPDHHAAFTVLYTRYTDSILGYCMVRIQNTRDAEDIAATIFTNAFASFPPDNRGTFRAWLFTIAHHEVVNYYRRQKARGPSRALDESYEHLVRDPATSPEEAALLGDAASSLDRALGKLTADQRSVVELRLAGLKGAEIAAVIGRSESAVKMLQHRAMERQRADLASDPLAHSTSAITPREHADAY